MNEAPEWLSPETAREVDAALQAVASTMEEIDTSLPNFAEMLTIEDQQRLEAFAMNFRRDLADGLAEAIVYGRDLGDVLIDTFRRAAAELVSSSLLDMLTGRSPGSSFAAQLFGNAGSLFGGKRAGGGPVSPGKAYLVGEKGPEPFIPTAPGVIIPNHVAFGGGRQQVHVSLSLDNDMLEAKVVRTSAGVVVHMEPRLTNKAVRTTVDSLSRPALM